MPYITLGLRAVGHFCVGPDIPVGCELCAHLRWLPDQHARAIAWTIEESPDHSVNASVDTSNDGRRSQEPVGDGIQLDMRVNRVLLI